MHLSFAFLLCIVLHSRRRLTDHHTHGKSSTRLAVSVHCILDWICACWQLAGYPDTISAVDAVSIVLVTDVEVGRVGSEWLCTNPGSRSHRVHGFLSSEICKSIWEYQGRLETSLVSYVLFPAWAQYLRYDRSLKSACMLDSIGHRLDRCLRRGPSYASGNIAYRGLETNYHVCARSIGGPKQFGRRLQLNTLKPFGWNSSIKTSFWMRFAKIECIYDQTNSMSSFSDSS